MDIKDILTEVDANSPGHYRILSMETLGDDLVINCPFHAGGRERTPSFSILTKPKQTPKGEIPMGVGHCFACGASTSLPKLVNYMLGKEEFNSEEWIKDKYGIDFSILPQERIKLPERETLAEALDYKHYPMVYDEFFVRRGITPESIQRFDIRVDYQKGYAVFPILNKQGVCQMIFKRSLQGKQFHNTSGARKDNLLFGLHDIYKTLIHWDKVGMDQVWIVESVIDAILLWQMGYPAIALLQAIPTDEQLVLIEDLPFAELIIATDNDEAGNKGYLRFEDKIRTKNIYRLIYAPHQKDIGDIQPQEMEEIKIAKSTRQNIRRGLSLR